MGIAWLGDRPWTEWTREERFFCAALYQHAARDPGRFVRLILGKAHMPQAAALRGIREWDVGYEVCFYRDYLWERRDLRERERPRSKGNPRKGPFPLKRTFDLCLFASEAMVIIEAKGFEAFSTKQNAAFKDDRRLVQRLVGAGFPVYLVALASSKYLGSPNLGAKTLESFDGRLSWADAAAEYGDRRLELADALYGRKPRGDGGGTT